MGEILNVRLFTDSFQPRSFFSALPGLCDSVRLKVSWGRSKGAM
jgi:hypothetical protein